MIEIEELIDIAQSVELGDPIDWSDLSIGEYDAYNLMANHILDQYRTNWSQLSPTHREIIMLATITKLLVENFTLNLK
jgi:hypothetical protein